MPIVRIPGALSRHVGGRVEVRLSGGTVAEVLEALALEAPELADAIVQGGVRVFVGENAAGGSTPLTPEDELFLVPSLAGG